MHETSIGKFFKPQTQFDLIELARTRSKNYEETYREYVKLFFAELQIALRLSENADKEFVYNLKKLLDEKDLESNNSVVGFFYKILDCYNKWITCAIKESIDIAESILEDVGAATSNKEIMKGEIFYRGRISEKPIEKAGIFHIPFNKTYLISNQRFSITGQPLLYLSDNEKGVLKELKSRIKEKIEERLYISRYVYNHNKSLKCFDLRIEVNDDFYSCTDNKFKEGFYRFILACVCSFPNNRDGDYAFVDEYVVPQILTQVIRNYGDCSFDGVCYESILPDNSENRCCNYALFTNKKGVVAFDDELRNKFIITYPVNILEMKQYNRDRLLIREPSKKKHILHYLKTWHTKNDQLIKSHSELDDDHISIQDIVNYFRNINEREEKYEKNILFNNIRRDILNMFFSEQKRENNEFKKI